MISPTKPLVMRTLAQPVRREVLTNLLRKADDLKAARDAMLNTRYAANRVADSIADRMQNALTW